MHLSLENLLSRKNLNLLVGLLTLLIVLWVIMFAIPGLFVSLFDTMLGNLLLIAMTVLAGMHDMNLGVGLGVVLLILWRFSHLSAIEGLIL